MSTEDARKLFVAGLPDTITEDLLRQLFGATGGTVVEVSIPRDRATGRPRGFGFVTLSSAEEAERARESLDGSLQAGRAISVRPFKAEPPRKGDGPGGPGRQLSHGPPPSPDSTIYVGNLPYDCEESEVQEMFAAAGVGNVVRVNLPMDPEGRKRGFGFVAMSSGDAAREALDALQGAEIRGRRLVIKVAHPKGERPARAESPRAMTSSPPRREPSSTTAPWEVPAEPRGDPPRRSFDERKRPRPSHEADGKGRRKPARPKERHRRRDDWRTDYLKDEEDDLKADVKDVKEEDDE